MDFKTVQHRLGHSSAKLTMDQYAHAMPENDERVAEIIGNLYSSGPKASEELQKTA
jgi:integrase